MDERRDMVAIPAALNAAVEKGMKDVRKIHERRVVRRTVGSVAGLAVFCAAFLVWGWQNPVLASQIPVIGRIFANVEDKITYSGDYSENAQVYDVAGATEEPGGDGYVYTASDSGYTFTVSEAYCDGDSLYLGLAVKKDGDFGNINSVYVEGYGEETVQYLMPIQMSLTIEGYGETDYGYSYWIEGVQTADDTFEGILRLPLLERGVQMTEDFDASLHMTEFLYEDANLTALQRENEEAHVLRDERGEPMIGEDGDWLMDDTYEPLVSEFRERGNWNFSLHVNVNASGVRIYELGDTVDGFGIAAVTVSPSEIRVEDILPPLYASQEEINEAKRAYLREIGDEEGAERMSDEELSDTVGILLYDDYGVALFDQNGQRIEVGNGTIAQGEQGFLYTYPIRQREITELHIYIGEDGIACMKETDEQAMAARAVYQTVVELE